MIKASVTALSLCALCACDSESIDVSIIDNTESVVPGSEFNGTWQSACRTSELDNTEDLYEITSLSIIGTRATSVITSFSDSACQDAVISDLGESTEITINYTISRPGEMTATGLGAATNVDLTATAMSISGVPLTAQDQLALGLENQRFDLFLTSNNSLFLGDTTGERDGTSEAERPDSLNQSSPLTRKFI